jgi:hypothetical protein
MLVKVISAKNVNVIVTTAVALPVKWLTDVWEVYGSIPTVSLF